MDRHIVELTCPPKIGPHKMRDSCRINTGGNRENKKVFRILQEVDAARRNGVSPATIHRWKTKYGGMTLPELKQLKALEEENARRKRIVAQQALDNELLKELNSIKW